MKLQKRSSAPSTEPSNLGPKTLDKHKRKIYFFLVWANEFLFEIDKISGKEDGNSIVLLPTLTFDAKMQAEFQISLIEKRKTANSSATFKVESSVNSTLSPKIQVLDTNPGKQIVGST